MKRAFKWLDRKIEPGMFSDEQTITVATRNGESVAVFVPLDCVKSGKFKVEAIRQAGHDLVVLPDADQTVVAVHPSQFDPA